MMLLTEIFKNEWCCLRKSCKMNDVAYENHGKCKQNQPTFWFPWKNSELDATNPFDAESNFLLGGGSGVTWNLPKWSVLRNKFYYIGRCGILFFMWFCHIYTILYTSYDFLSFRQEIIQNVPMPDSDREPMSTPGRPRHSGGILEFNRKLRIVNEK